MSTGENPIKPLVEEQRDKHYHSLRQVMDEAGVVLAPTDRDLAPEDHHGDDDALFEEAAS